MNRITPAAADKTELSAVVSNYLAASEARDIEAIVKCFSQDAEVLDEGNFIEGRDQIRRWREDVAAAFEYTATMTSVTALREEKGTHRYAVCMHLEGNFPGGQADLNHTFAVRDEHIVSLRILPASS
ncbi:nuclear transport factor 2 family protein [Mycobacterium sp. D16R24]|uniref:nuclear transport factor 2 family protein n=1 Tax=Mycobacterium sp. D16R24 TaxID=1855656 RepID=UPI001591CD7D|nr:nuclear transport factor 2 family protein [Mycobacterium sp. D16R24]